MVAYAISTYVHSLDLLDGQMSFAILFNLITEDAKYCGNMPSFVWHDLYVVVIKLIYHMAGMFGRGKFGKFSEHL